MANKPHAPLTEEAIRTKILNVYRETRRRFLWSCILPYVPGQKPFTVSPKQSLHIANNLAVFIFVSVQRRFLRTRSMKTSQLLTFAAAVVLGGFGAVLPVGEAPMKQAMAQTTRPKIRFVKPKLSRDRGAPGKRGEGASRTCESENRLASLTALVPRYSQAGQKAQVLGKTTKSHPKLAFYVPVAANEVESVSLMLMLMDEEGNFLDEVAVEAPQEPGIVQVALPESFAGLEEGDRVQWHLDMELLCLGDLDDANYSSVSGWVEREAMPEGVEAAITINDVADNAQIFASLGLWFDALELVTEQRQNHPTDESVAADWAALMESIELEALAEAEVPSTTKCISQSDNSTH